VCEDVCVNVALCDVDGVCACVRLGELEEDGVRLTLSVRAWLEDCVVVAGIESLGVST
jgi:hypothetical protein